MNNYLTKKIISQLKFLMNSDERKNEYKEIFWPNFGSILKEGLCEPLNTEARENILNVCLFSSSKRIDSLISLKEYVDAMPENQKEIFYLTGSNIEEMMRDPQLEGFIEKGIEVLLLKDGVDDFWTTVTLEFQGKKFKSISLTDIDLEKISGEKKDDQSEEDKNNEEQSLSEDDKKLIDFFKSVLGDAVKEVVISKRLSSSPACLGISEGGMNMKMERFLIEQKQIGSKSLKIFEINKNHHLISKISDALKKDTSENFDDLKHEFCEKVWNLFDFTSIIQGEELFDPKEFSRRASKILDEMN
jgi:molecular chaperone HtpG